jgi:hypothetical protein
VRPERLARGLVGLGTKPWRVHADGPDLAPELAQARW